MKLACHSKVQRVVLFMWALLLAGCAGQSLHRDGVALLAGGRVEEGLAKLAEASEREPEVASYRADYLRYREQAMSRLLMAANSERVAGRPDIAREIFKRLLRMDPDDSRARLGLESLDMDKRHEAALAEAEAQFRNGALESAQSTIRPVLQENPRNGRAAQLLRQVEEQAAKERLPEPRLQLKFAKPVTLQFRDASLKLVFEALARTSGINVLLDRDVKTDLKTSIFVKDVSVEDTIELILLQNQLEKKVISDNTVFIYPSTPAKLKDYQDLKIRSFHLTHADPKQILAMLKGLLKTRDIFIHEKTNSVVMRDTPEAIRIAEKLVADQDIAEPEVMLEVEVLEVSRTRLSELGIKLPNALTVATPETVSTIGALRALRTEDLLVSGLTASLNLKLEDGVTNVLASPRIRVRNREKAKIMIGSRVPVITNAVTPVSTGTPVITGSVQYLDVGLKLDVEPDIHLDNEVVIKVGLDVSSIIREVPNAQSGTLAYEIGTRNANTVLRLKDGETQILAGLINDEDRYTTSKLPILGQVPLLGRLFSNHKDDNKKTEIVLSITPRIVGSARLANAEHIEYWAGTESNLRSSPLNIRGQGSIVVNSAAAGAPVQPGRPQMMARTPAQQGSRAAQATAPVTLFWQGPSEVKVGDVASMTLNAQTVQALGSLNLALAYDPQVFRAISVEEGSFMRQEGMSPTFSSSIDTNSGQIILDLAGRSPDGVTGTGSVARIVFEAIANSPRTQITAGRIVSTGAEGNALVANLPDAYAIAVLP